MAIDPSGLNGCDSEPPFSAGRREAIRAVAVRARAASKVSAASTGATGNVTNLLAGASDGDPAAWDEVMRRYDKVVSTTVRSFRLQDADALDAVQATWLRVGIEQQAIEAHAARTLWRLVEELSPRQRTLLRALVIDHPRPYAEVARTAGIPPGAIGPTRARALQQLRDRLNEHGLGPRHGDEIAAASTPCAARGPVARSTTQPAANRVINSSSCINAAALAI